MPSKNLNSEYIHKISPTYATTKFSKPPVRIGIGKLLLSLYHIINIVPCFLFNTLKVKIKMVSETSWRIQVILYHKPCNRFFVQDPLCEDQDVI